MSVHVVGIGGTLRGDSSSAKALRHCLDHARAAGATTSLFTGDALRAPLYEPQPTVPTTGPESMIAALRQADGVILASPGYHGSISGTLKNALDYTEEMAGDPDCYFEGRAVGCIAAAAGWQAAGATLATLRAITHSLRGWPTPLGVLINSSEPTFDSDGRCIAAATAASLSAMTDQVLEFAVMRQAIPTLARAIAS
jgi:FMN reductase